MLSAVKLLLKCMAAGLALGLLLPAMAWAAGSVVAIGGALRDDNAAVWGRVVQLAGGAGARFAVLATASGEPQASAAAIVANLQRHGALAVALPVAPGWPGVDAAAAVADPRWLEALARSQGVFFSGGAQARLLDTLQPGDGPGATPWLLAHEDAAGRMLALWGTALADGPRLRLGAAARSALGVDVGATVWARAR